MSPDLRIRVIRIEGGMSRTAAAKRFGVAAVRMQTYLTGRSRAKPCGGDRSGRLEAQAGFLMDAVQQTPDITSGTPTA